MKKKESKLLFHFDLMYNVITNDLAGEIVCGGTKL